MSTEEQARQGVSLDAQEARVRAYATATGRELAMVVADHGQSGKTLNRPGLQQILDGIRAGDIGAIVVLKLDRLTRSVRDLADLLEIVADADAALISVSEHLNTGTAGGRLFLNLLVAVSQWEREAIGERTALALAHKRTHRQVYGHAPFGFRRHGNLLVKVNEEQRALQRMRAMRATGATLRQIADWLAARGFPPRQGGRAWYPASVARVLGSRMVQEL